MCSKDAPVWKLAEWERIRTRRQRAFGVPNAKETQTDEEGTSIPLAQEPKNLVGLSLSGGGIRSAIYNDGFLQGLSHRGFLRYVDYLCSVSGGGYIAGHLITQTREADDQGEKVFHDDEVRHELGRDPITGNVNASRLAGVGGYLSRSLEFLPAYLWSFFFSFAFYIGIVGIVATIAALFWRSFDDPTFRTLYLGALGLIKGDELTIAFIPTILLVVLATVSELFLSCWRIFFGFDRPREKQIHLIVRKVSLVFIVLAILTSIAIFIGNGKTYVSSNAGGELFLNKYAQLLAISAGVIQILMFLGRDRLFRSERAEAKQWQKYLQRSITTIVLLFLVFSMVHWMGREDISGYTQNRDPHLVRGDVTNWYVLDQLFSAFEPNTAQRTATQPPLDVYPPKYLTSLDKIPENARPASKWVAYLTAGREGLNVGTWKTGDDLSHPPSPLQEHDSHEKTGVWSLPKRIAGACVAYWLAMSCPDEQDIPPLLDMRYQRFRNSPNRPAADNSHEVPDDDLYLPFNDSPDGSVREFIDTAFTNVHIANQIQDERLEHWNNYLEQRQFTTFLLDSKKDASSKALTLSTPSTNELSALSPLLSERIAASIDAKLSGVQRQNLLRDDLPSQRLARAARNRLLLETLLPDAVQKQQVASTLVVPPHDQHARRHWLCLWAVLTLIGMIGGLGQNHIATVFQFYRQQLGTNFLVATHNPKQQLCDRQLYELNPTDDGLPYPLFLAATLEPTTCNGSYQVEAKPFVFSPLFSGRFDANDAPIPSKQLSFSSSPASRAVTLGDAITLSGAAVTPLMTSNRWLSVILDFFNTGIGQRLQRLDRTGHEIRRLRTRPIVTSAIVIVIAALAAHALIGLSSIMVVVIGLLTCLACYCIVQGIGSPGLINSLVFPRNRDTEESAPSARDHGRSFYVADGGFYDYLGVSELLRRRCELIVVSDTGANIGNDPLGTLAQMCERASQEMGIRFLDLDHESPIDFGRLELNEQRLVHQPYLCMRIRYPEPESSEEHSESRPLEGRLFYCQMSITDNDPIEIQHIRNRFPSFPDEPTVNQFYSEEQVSAYRALGYHIANRLCNELQSWQDVDATAETPSNLSDVNPRKGKAFKSQSGNEDEVEAFRERLFAGHADVKSKFESASGEQLMEQPWFDVLRERLLTAYRLACYEELSYRKDDIFSEAIWLSKTYAFPAFRSSVRRVLNANNINKTPADRWLREYERSADVRSAYRTAVLYDINELTSSTKCYCQVLWSAITDLASDAGPARDIAPEHIEKTLAGHLTNIATACQEIHCGRPHATFQIGGREKLINLCDSLSKAIAPTLHVDPEKILGKDAKFLFDTMDKIIVELIELERSVFQGGEHVTAISLAQCMTSMWGRVARFQHEEPESGVEVVPADVAALLKQLDLMTVKTNPRSALISQAASEFQVTEVRRRLDIGLKRTRVHLIRNALVTAWCIGRFSPNELQAGSDFLQDQLTQQQKKPRRRSTNVPTKINPKTSK